MLNNPEETYADMDDDSFAEALNSGSLNEESPVETSTDSDEDDVTETTTEVAEDTTDETTEEGTETEDDIEETENDESSEEEDDAGSDESDDSADAQLKELFEPFKASGSEMSVKSVAEAKQLMKMGVDYQSKMRDMKPHRNTIKTLKNNGIDAEQLNYLIDLSKGNKDAIAKLVKEHNFEVDFDQEENSSYSPSNHHASDAEVDLDEVISRIQDSPSFSTTTDIVSSQWDSASKQAVFENPKYLEDLNTHVSNGTYKRVNDEVIRQRTFGGLQGLSDLQAYGTVCNQFDAEARANAQKEQAPAKVVKTAPVKVSNNTDKKLRASPSKRAPKSTAPVVDNYANFDDEAFAKLLKQ